MKCLVNGLHILMDISYKKKIKKIAGIHMLTTFTFPDNYTKNGILNLEILEIGFHSTIFKRFLIDNVKNRNS